MLQYMYMSQLFEILVHITNALIKAQDNTNALIKAQDNTVKPVLSRHSNRRPKLVFKTNYRLMLVKNIAECSKGSILQYFRPSLSYHMPVRSLFCLFVSGHLRQVLLYIKKLVLVFSSKSIFSVWKKQGHVRRLVFPAG